MLPDQRQHPRKIFRTTVSIFLNEGRGYEASSVDLSIGGICVTLRGKNLQPGQMCALSFNLFTRGKAHKINTVAKVAYSVCSGNEFKIGFQFMKMDAGCTAAIESFMT